MHANTPTHTHVARLCKNRTDFSSETLLVINNAVIVKHIGNINICVKLHFFLFFHIPLKHPLFCLYFVHNERKMDLFYFIHCIYNINN